LLVDHAGREADSRLQTAAATATTATTKTAAAKTASTKTASTKTASTKTTTTKTATINTSLLPKCDCGKSEDDGCRQSGHAAPREPTRENKHDIP
jgi:hypothetical protein